MLEQANPRQVFAEGEQGDNWIIKLASVYKEKGRARSMVEDRCLGGTLDINWDCSFQGQPINGSMGNASALSEAQGQG